MAEDLRHPLHWPAGWPRTKANDRRRAQFSRRRTRTHSFGSYTTKCDLSLTEAVDRIYKELTAFTRAGRAWRTVPDNAILSTNVALRLDGLPRSGQKAPDDPGAVLYFELDGRPQAIPCDTYTRVEDNVAAIAAVLNALRALERHGSGLMEAAFRGYEALPESIPDPWHQVLGVPEDAPAEVVRAAYRRLRKETHPDHGGDASQFDRVQKAWARWEAGR